MGCSFQVSSSLWARRPPRPVGPRHRPVSVKAHDRLCADPHHHSWPSRTALAYPSALTVTPGRGELAWGMARRPHYHVYVVELSDQVWNSPRFRRSNPDYRLGMPFVYVGMTGQDPDIRFDKHKAGIKANSFVRDHGLRLLPQLYERHNPMPYEAAREMEVELGIALRRAGYGVWQA